MRGISGRMGHPAGTPGGTAPNPHTAHTPLVGINQGLEGVFGDEVYLWILVALEIGAITWARSAFSRYHGG